MSESKGLNHTQIIVAILSLLGVLGGALIANWDTVFGHVEADDLDVSPEDSIIPDPRDDPGVGYIEEDEEAPAEY